MNFLHKEQFVKQQDDVSILNEESHMNLHMFSYQLLLKIGFDNFGVVFECFMVTNFI